MSEITAADVMRFALAVAVGAPFLAAVGAGLLLLLRQEWSSEGLVSGTISRALQASLLASAIVIVCHNGLLGPAVTGNVEYGDWLTVGTYSVPVLALVDGVSLSFSLLAAALTTLVARFSRTYLHREAGFARFFILLGIFAAGAQLVAFAGALDVFFAGWELIGISSALFIGFFHERDEPVRSSLRAFTTYRLCDVGLLVATVTTHEVFGSTRFSVLADAGTLPAVESATLAALFLLAAMGKSAQLPFSGWLPRAMEGPTPSSALFYGAVSIHAGLYLMLRVSPVLAVAPIVAAAGVVVGLLTALYAAAVARVHTDAKGTLAHATLAQTGLILAEISMGWTQLALAHLVTHALLRVYQYLRAPNMIHDVHQHGHIAHGAPLLSHRAPRLADWMYAAAVHRLRLDEQIDRLVVPVLWLAHLLSRADERLSGISKPPRS